MDTNRFVVCTIVHILSVCIRTYVRMYILDCTFICIHSWLSVRAREVGVCLHTYIVYICDRIAIHYRV